MRVQASSAPPIRGAQAVPDGVQTAPDGVQTAPEIDRPVRMWQIRTGGRMRVRAGTRADAGQRQILCASGSNGTMETPHQARIGIVPASRRRRRQT
jgi:hypothetical protein